MDNENDERFELKYFVTGKLYEQLNLINFWQNINFAEKYGILDNLTNNV